jgi:hypothetical protein|tara:strand:- start:230 stop:472 length:243 start_codon:yes stop_codon:yes gene_type:complete
LGCATTTKSFSDFCYEGGISEPSCGWGKRVAKKVPLLDSFSQQGQSPRAKGGGTQVLVYVDNPNLGGREDSIYGGDLSGP